MQHIILDECLPRKLTRQECGSPTPAVCLENIFLFPHLSPYALPTIWRYGWIHFIASTTTCMKAVERLVPAETDDFARYTSSVCPDSFAPPWPTGGRVSPRPAVSFSAQQGRSLWKVAIRLRGLRKSYCEPILSIVLLFLNAIVKVQAQGSCGRI